METHDTVPLNDRSCHSVVQQVIKTTNEELRDILKGKCATGLRQGHVPGRQKGCLVVRPIRLQPGDNVLLNIREL